MTQPKQGPNRGNAGKGRPKGSLNRSTASVKAALLEAFEGTGGVKSLIAWGKENQTEFYKLLGRLIPVEVTGDGGGPIEHQHVWKFGAREVSF